MLRIADAIENLLNRAQGAPELLEFDVLVVGSGYGGAVAAALMAGCSEQGRAIRVGVLERGEEYLPGEFPSRLGDLPRHVRGVVGDRPFGQCQGLFDLRLAGDMHVIVGSGVGGGSLINAGVMEAPLPAVFDQRWPEALRQPDALDFSRTRRLLEAEREDGRAVTAHDFAGPGGLAKLHSLKQLAGGLVFREAAIAVAGSDGRNGAGVHMKACNLCGDCVTGCNHGAKNTLDKTLLARARARGAEIYTSVGVSRVERHGDGRWRVCAHYAHEKLRAGRPGPFHLLAGRVILAAGSLGSTEILLRSQSGNLRFSRMLGGRFSGNGDAIAAGHDQAVEANAVADESQRPEQRNVGPSITGFIDLRDAEGVLIEEMAVPGPLRWVFEELVTSTNTLYHLSRRDESAHARSQPDKDPYALHSGALRRSSLYAMMGDDGGDGRLELIGQREDPLVEGYLKVCWPGVGDRPLYKRQIELLRRMSRDSGVAGTVLGNPSWDPIPDSLESMLYLPRGPLLTVHPLGGCAMADHPERGVVDAIGRVYDCRGGPSATRLHDGLAVLDGSIIPSALGVNPSLTIAAVALRAAERLRDEWGLTQAAPPELARWTGQPAPAPSEPEDTPEARPVATEIQVTERVVGRVHLETDHGAQEFVLELTLRFQPKPAADYFRQDADSPKRTATVDTRAEPGVPTSELRLFRPERWEELVQTKATEDALQEAALLCAPVSGELEILLRDTSTSEQRRRRALRAWLLNRGLRDTWQALGRRIARMLDVRDSLRRPSGRPPFDLRQHLRSLSAVATHAGEVRLFAYRLRVHRPAGGWPAWLPALQGPEHGLRGEKRIGYTRRPSPLRQLSELTLLEFPGLAGPVPVLRFDSRFLARRQQPLLRVTQYETMPQALADVLSFFGYFARLLTGLHFWTFRRPERPEARQPDRLAGRMSGLPKPVIYAITVDHLPNGLPVQVRLTRYPNANGGAPPLVMIHGYSASSTTWAHPAVTDCAARYFHARGRDVWLLDLRTSAGLLTALLPWTFEQVAFQDIPAAFDHIQRETGAEQCDVIAHCMGAAMLSMAVLESPRPGERFFLAREELPRRLRRVVLCQVGPAVSFSPANMARGYLVSFVRHHLGNVPYAFRPSDAPGAPEQMLDRILSALPYPDSEYDRENPLRFWERRGWVGTRHRIDALYSRAFAVGNLSDKVLASIDDMFGPMSMGTLAQTVHFAQHEQITNPQGEGVYANREKLARRWSFPTFSLHGAENGLADPATTRQMAQLMADAGCDYRAKIYSGFGHQDLLIGNGCARVFEDVQRFLGGETISELQPSAHPRPRYSLCLPALGPVIGDPVDSEPDQLWPVMLGTDPALGEPDWVLFVALDEGGMPQGNVETPCAAHMYLTPAPPARHQWMKFALRRSRNSGRHWQAIVIYDHLRALCELPPSSASDNVIDSLKGASPLAALAGELLASDAFREGYHALMRRPTEERRIGIVSWPAPVGGPVRIAVASCQFPPLIQDSGPAYGSYRRLAKRLDGAARPELLLLLGDQVYVDPTAGLADATEYHDRFVATYHRWLGSRDVREVLRRLPSRMMPDDHEFLNDFHGQRGHRYFEQGRETYLLFQRQLTQMPQVGSGMWHAFRQRDVACFLADTRTERDGGDTQDPRRLIMSGTQFDALLDWLVSEDADRPKVVSSAALLLPRRRHTLSGPGAFVRSDGWDGYPAQQHRLLEHLVRHRVRNLVFVSGDEHLSMTARVQLRSPGAEPLTFFSVHSSPLHAPMRFINARPADFVTDDVFDVTDRIQCHAAARFHPGDGFVVLDFERSGMNWRVRCTFDRAEGEQQVELEL